MQAFVTETMGAAQRYWRMALIRGIIAIMFGIIVIVWPHLTFRLFFFIFGIFAIIEGIVLCANAFSHRHASKTESEPYQGPVSYQRTEEPGQRGTAYQRTEPAQGSASYQATQGSAAGYRRPESTQGVRPSYRSSPFQKNWITLFIEGVLTIICGILSLILPAFVAALAIYVVAAWAMFKGIGALMQVHQRGWAMALIGIVAIIMSLFLFIDPFGAIRTFLWGIGVFAIILGVILVARGLKQNASMRRAAPPPEPSY